MAACTSAAGVTTVRDMGNDNATLQQLMAQEKAGDLLSPSVVPAGFIEGESKMSARNGFVIKDLAEAKKAIDWYAEHGYPQVKIYNSFPKDILRDTAAYAHEQGHARQRPRAGVHARAGRGRAGLRRDPAHQPGDAELLRRRQDRYPHAAALLPGRPTRPRTWISTRKPVQDFIAMLAQKQIVIDPTLATFEFLHQRDGELSPIVAAVADHLPPDVQRGRRVGEMNIPDDATAARYTKSFAKLVEFVGRMYKAGVPIVAGTDEVAGFTLQRELELYVQAGMTPSQALQVATWNGAKYTRMLRRARFDHARQARRPDAGRRRPDHQHLRHPQGRAGDQERHCLLSERALRSARREAVRRSRAHSCRKTMRPAR